MFPYLLRKAARQLHDRRTFQGLKISVENQKGSSRQWYDPNEDREGMTRQPFAYGYIRGTLGVDGDQVDCYLGPNGEAKTAFVIHTRKAPDFKEYDEDKVMLGFATAQAALAAFRKAYDKPGFFGGMTAIEMPVLKEILKTTRTKPRKLTIPGR